MLSSVVAVSSSPSHSFSKLTALEIELLTGLGVQGDAHCGVTVKHRSRVAQDPTRPNLRQVHLIQSELFSELAEKGFSVLPGQLGENITTRGLDLLALPADSELCIGASAVVRLTGLRNPCGQLDRFQSGLMSALLERTSDGTLHLRAGVMGVVVSGGTLRVGDPVRVDLPAAPHRALERV